jgi:dipeptidyl aminopeptidase/acylaminoacyl peptidase
LPGGKKIATIMIDDIYDGANWAIKNGYADSSKIYLYGHSYGGYAAIQSLIKHKNFYKGAVSVAAPTNIVDLREYSDDIGEDFSYEFWKTTIGDPSNEKKNLQNISPYFKMELITAPVLMFHGENDKIVPPSQTEEFGEKAKDLGLNIKYKIIKDEYHQISQNRNLAYILEKAIEFFNSCEKK